MSLLLIALFIVQFAVAAGSPTYCTLYNDKHGSCVGELSEGFGVNVECMVRDSVQLSLRTRVNPSIGTVIHLDSGTGPYSTFLLDNQTRVVPGYGSTGHLDLNGGYYAEAWNMTLEPDGLIVVCKSAPDNFCCVFPAGGGTCYSGPDNQKTVVCPDTTCASSWGLFYGAGEVWVCLVSTSKPNYFIQEYQFDAWGDQWQDEFSVQC